MLITAILSTAEPEEIYGECGDDKNTDPYRMTDERHTRKGYRQEHHQTDIARIAAAVKRTDSEDEDRDKDNGIDEHTHVVAHAEAVDEHQLEPLGDLHEARHKTVEDSAHDDARHTQSDERAYGIDLLPLAVVKDKSESRNTEKIKEMDCDRNTYDICYQNEIAVAEGLVGTVFPFQHEPEHQCRAERRECIYLALDSREPESVAPGISQGATETRTHDHGKLPGSDAIGVVAHKQTAGKMCHRPEKEQNGACAEQCRHRVDGQCRGIHAAAEKRNEETSRKHEDRVARRVTDFELGALRYELGTIPETCGRFDRQEICHGSHHEG